MYTEELYEEGVVKEAHDGIAIISIQDSDKCEECSAKIYCRTNNKEGRSLTARDPYGVHPGDNVRIVIKGSKLIAASFLLYGIPLLLLLAGIFIGMEIFRRNKELYSSLTGVGLVFLYTTVLFLFSKKAKSKPYPEIVFVNSPR